MSSSTVGRSGRLSIGSYLVIAFALLIFVQTFAILSPIYLSFLLTLIISLALNPLVNRLRSLTGGRKGATGLVTFAMVAIIALAGWAFITPLASSAADLWESMPAYWERLQKPLIKMEQRAKRSEERLQAEVNSESSQNESEKTNDNEELKPTDAPADAVSKGSNSIRSSLAQMLRSTVESVTKFAFNGAQMLVVLVTVFFGVIFMLMNPRPIIGALFSMVPEKHLPKALLIVDRICKFAPAWGGSTLAGMFTIGLLVFILMWPLLGFSDALVLGLISGLLEAIPFLGPTLSAVPALLLAIGEGGMTPLWVLLAYVGIQALENNVILPLIMARGMKLNAVAIIFSMLLCVSAFGVLGVLVASPLVAIVSILHDELYRKQFLPTVTDEDLDRLSGKVLHDKKTAGE